MILIEEVAVGIGKFRLDQISFEVPSGDYAVLMGQTGSGKTTLLECICGLRDVESGQIILDERDVTRLRPAERGIGYVPQDGALFSTMTVRQHLEFPLRIRGWSSSSIRKRTGELSQLLGIEHLLDRRPRGLSGGESQRVALGRALSFRPTTLLLDEPLSALDDATRARLYSLLKEIQTQTNVTTLHITHSRAEARELADRMFILESGAVQLKNGEFDVDQHAS